jgi:arylsulfatase A-like enzyme
MGQDSIYWPERQGFDINIGGHHRGSPPGGYFSPYENPRLADGPEGEYLTDRLGRESAQFLSQIGQQPFLLYLSFYSVHTPLQAQDSLVANYERKAAELGYEEAERHQYNAPWISTAPQQGNFRERLVQDHAVYAAMVESMDRNVGRVLDALRANGLDGNTIVFFMSDNGGLATSEGSPTTNDPLRAGKGWLYEGGIREPMIIKWPGRIAGGQERDTPVISTDFYPTILDMAGLPLRPEQHLDGMSLVPILTQSDALDREALYWHYPHYSNQGGRPGGIIREGRYKLIEFYEQNTFELYDLQTDISETNDLSDLMPEKTEELKAKLASWRQSVDAEMMDPNPEFDPDYRRVQE